MFVVENTDEYRLITQPDHANMSGKIAVNWGNATFSDPEPKHSLVVAAEDHDHGWKKYDLYPRIEGNEKKPIDFIEISSDDWTSFYGTGVQDSTEVDPYGGLMVSMHASGLRRQGYGVRPKIPDLYDDPGYADFVDEQEKFQEELIVDLQDSEILGDYATQKEQEFLHELHERGDHEKVEVDGYSRTWYNYNLLQVFDRIAIYFCDNDPLEETTIAPMPRTYDSEMEELHIQPIGDKDVRLDPYPFETSPLTLEVDARFIPKTYETQEELIRTYYLTERKNLEFTVCE